MSDETEKTIRIRIQNGGDHAYGTLITDANTGKEIENIMGLSWSFDLNDGKADYSKPPRVKITVYDPVIDVIADAEIRKVCPCCGNDAKEVKEAQADITIKMLTEKEMHTLLAEEVSKALAAFKAEIYEERRAEYERECSEMAE